MHLVCSPAGPDQRWDRSTKSPGCARQHATTKAAVRHTFLQLSGPKRRPPHESVKARVPATLRTFCDRPLGSHALGSHAPSFSRRISSEFYQRSRRPPKSEGAGKVGSWPLPWPACEKKCRRQNHRFGRTSRPSLRDGFAAYTRSSRGPAVLPPSPAIRHRRLGISTGMPEPRDFTVAPDRSSA
jgi:hypothetical protein